MIISKFFPCDHFPLISLAVDSSFRFFFWLRVIYIIRIRHFVFFSPFSFSFSSQIYLPLPLPLSVSQFVSQSVSLIFCLSVCLSVRLSVCLSVCPSSLNPYKNSLSLSPFLYFFFFLHLKSPISNFYHPQYYLINPPFSFSFQLPSFFQYCFFHFPFFPLPVKSLLSPCCYPP